MVAPALPQVLLAPEAPKIELRPYQNEAIEAILTAWKQQESPRALVVLPTGLGKTVIFAALLKRLNEPALILAHREELLTQAREKILMVNPAADVGIISGNLNLKQLGHQITVGSVLSVINPQILAYLADAGIKTVIVDECHHSAAVSYNKILDALRAGYPGGCKLLGVTATADRADGLDIEAVFGSPTFTKSLIDAICEGYLADLRGIRVQTKTSLEGIKTRMGDYAENELAARVNKRERNEVIVKAWLEHAKGKPTLCFTVDVQHARDLAATFAAYDVRSACLDAKTPREVRQSIIRDYQHGAIDVICNCGVLTEGFDAPQTSCIIMARPTKSRPLFVQCVGRGTRLAPGKDDCLVLDVCDVASRHSLVAMNMPKLVGKEDYPTESKTGVKSEGVSLKAIHYAEGEKVVSQEIMLLPKWQQAPQGRYKLELPTKDQVWLAPRGDQGYIVGLVFADGHKQELLSKPVALDWAQQFANQKALDIQGGKKGLIDERAPWRQRQASDKQKALMDKLRINWLPGITAGDAAKLIDARFLKINQAKAAKKAGA